jgi:hypothetical protein
VTGAATWGERTAGFIPASCARTEPRGVQASLQTGAQRAQEPNEDQTSSLVRIRWAPTFPWAEWRRDAGCRHLAGGPCSGGAGVRKAGVGLTPNWLWSASDPRLGVSLSASLSIGSGERERPGACVRRLSPMSIVREARTPVSLPPTSSHARAIPMSSDATKMSLIRPRGPLRGWKRRSMPPPSSTPKITSSQTLNMRWRPRQPRVEGLATTDRVAAALKKTPITPTTTAGYPTLVPGTRLNSETANALVNARRAAEARTSWRTSEREFGVRRSATVMTTNKRPVSAAADVAIAANRSR